MLTFHVITLFPELIEAYCNTSIIGRGIRTNRLSVRAHNPRDFCQDKYRKVDDTPYGGGAGMVLKPEPFFATLDSIRRNSHDPVRSAKSPVLLMTPQGAAFKQEMARNFSQEEELIIICGHYEALDERIHSLATHEISIGDYVLTGGELPALAVIDAVGRLVSGVLGASISLAEESFDAGLLEPPQYTKPPEFQGMVVPEILRSGDHQAVAKWRRQEALKRTWQRRPDLLAEASLAEDDQKFLDKLKKEVL
jgi:tRNA (guanine37-N1)-methyltransferase